MMLDVKTIADTLTAGRFLLALVIFWLGLRVGQPALPTVTLTLVLGWASDLLDGALARRAINQRHTWLGDNDLSVDVCVALGLLGYLTFSGYVSPAIAVSYVLMTGALIWRFRSRALAMAAQAPVYAILLYLALRDAQLYGALAVGWIALTVIVTWPRFPETVVPEFIQGMRELGGDDDD
jgi:phosphatidylglycerophosphate synthase